jgi:hypothetical protein
MFYSLLSSVNREQLTMFGNSRSRKIGAWLKSQQGVKSVQLADYLSKSNPPQRDFMVELKTVGGSTVRKIVNIFDLGNQQFQFRQLRDE